MSVCTDNPAWGRVLLPARSTGAFEPCATGACDDATLTAVLGSASSLSCAPLTDPDLAGWTLLARDSAPGSQYDALIELVRARPLPDRLACVARTGTGFHGFKGRSWSAEPGNIHLTVHLAPNRPIEHLHSAFTVMAAVAALDAIDAVPGFDGAARVKWVNDVLVSGAKVAGVLAYTQTRADVVASVIIGIGLNVEATPSVQRSAWVPAAGSLRGLAADPAQVEPPVVLRNLLAAIERRYELLLAEGNGPLVEIYRTRSAILGREVSILADDGSDPAGVIAAGRVTAIGDGLELYVEGHAGPITRGRLVLGAAEGVA
jgi:biotin-[acetyl-CoA-carboxylase] ligase BirA-like protein